MQHKLTEYATGSKPLHLSQIKPIDFVIEEKSLYNVLILVK
jgi:hypothetical protein